MTRKNSIFKNQGREVWKKAVVRQQEALDNSHQKNHLKASVALCLGGSDFFEVVQALLAGWTGFKRSSLVPNQDS